MRGLVIVESTIHYIFIVAIFIVAIVIFVLGVFPMIQIGALNACYGKMVSDFNLITPQYWEFGDYKNVTVEFGECTAGLIFVNKDLMDLVLDRMGDLEEDIKDEYDREIDLKGQLNCNFSKQSHIIAVPRFEESADAPGGMVTWIVIGAGLGSRLGWPGMAGGAGVSLLARDKITKLYDDLEKAGKKPQCISLDKKFADSRTVPEFGEEIAEKYCIVLYKGDLYRIEAFEGSCEERGDEVSATLLDMRGSSNVEERFNLRELARKYYDEKDCAKAVPVYEKLITDYPEDYAQKDMDMGNLAYCYYTTGLYDKAIAMAIQLVEAYPSSQYAPEALNTAASSYEEMGKMGLAVVRYVEIIDSYPDSVWVGSSKISIRGICETSGAPVRCQDLDKSKYYPEGS